jgi:hypothetical protein
LQLERLTKRIGSSFGQTFGKMVIMMIMMIIQITGTDKYLIFANKII